MEEAETLDSTQLLWNAGSARSLRRSEVRLFEALAEMDVSLFENSGSGIHESVRSSSFDDEDVARMGITNLIASDKT